MKALPTLLLLVGAAWGRSDINCDVPRAVYKTPVNSTTCSDGIMEGWELADKEVLDECRKTMCELAIVPGGGKLAGKDSTLEGAFMGCKVEDGVSKDVMGALCMAPPGPHPCDSVRVYRGQECPLGYHRAEHHLLKKCYRQVCNAVPGYSKVGNSIRGSSEHLYVHVGLREACTVVEEVSTYIANVACFPDTKV
eukprot:Sspe_Gene.8836::Locus_2980_Transcript_1_1_Confidence_1.000_Length_943::g.8836::m.8836